MQNSKSASAVAKEMVVGKAKITQVSKGKAEILDDIANKVPGERKRKRHTEAATNKSTVYVGVGSRRI